MYWKMKGVDEIRFNWILKRIKAVRIQGAEKVAKAGIEAFLLNPKKSSARKILKTRPTEPLMQNAIKFLLKADDHEKASNIILKDINKSHEAIVKAGAKLIKKNMKIYTHCHSSTVMDILKYAKKKLRKNFTVYTTEVEPLLQGHKTAKDLARARIKVIILPDLAAEQALKNCDLFLFGADAFTKKVVVNKVGTSTLCRLAELYHIPRYACGVSLKFTNKVKIEMRSPKEILKKSVDMVKVINPAFDKTEFKLLTGVISEFGILKTNEFVRKAKNKLKNL